ncbi:RNA polymerase sigma factor [Dactylosporangium siamense]|uniref:DNA-directed RNA polymerase sigma-70 factor n=1 Tax=Dactylosporangium siamense TaxID=685454 RepID=A0A919PX50_9ACTN|nr:RNA polymerase sigma factor [Dactylosporangium siamense]GIG52395.1 DNA-directed RNA polymerase sigma-70 factor [Dactylosporangium siamense]
MTTIVQATDAELWAKALNGDQAAFSVLFDRHAKAVYNHCFRAAASWVMAEDATQSTFLIAWRKRDQVRLVDGSVLPWLLSTATNAVRDERRSARRWLAALLRMPPDRDAAVEVADQVAERVDDIRRVRTVLRAVRHLPRAEREALMLCVWSSVSYADAARVLGIAESSVRARVSKARSRLDRLLRHGTVEKVSATNNPEE